MCIVRQKCKCSTRIRYQIGPSLGSRNKCEHPVVRWIGFSKRRRLEIIRRRSVGEESVIQLSWAQTFGRPVSVITTGIVQPMATVVPFGSPSR
jgi:hypothetical protein